MSFGVKATKRPIRQYTEEQYNQAILWATETKMPIREISRLTTVPRTTISDHRREKSKIKGSKMGRPPFFSQAEEDGLAYWIKEMGLIHHPMTRFELFIYLGKWLKNNDRAKELSKSGIPGEEI